ncbi:MAG: adenosylhomocysteinase [Clostridiales bacterium]|nr:adenosylhomocysteinase [Clostridiales bacterium]
MSIVANAALAPSGKDKIAWVRAHMPILEKLEERLSVEKPFAGLKIAMSIHMEAKTARLALLLKEAGAEVYATGCNPLSTQDDVAAGLAEMGVEVFAVHGVTSEEYHDHLVKTLECKPHIVIDDGGDLTQILHEERTDLAVNVMGGCEETTTGVRRLRARAAEGKLNYPVVCVNDAQMKYLFDNRYGTGQSVWDGIMRTTNLIVAGKLVVVAGYGWCGKGCAMRAKGMGARVAVCEVDPVRAVEAAMDGCEVMPMAQAAKVGDMFVTVTGCKDVITMEHMMQMKEGALLMNAGHFDVEIDVAGLRREAVECREARNNIERFTLSNGKHVDLLAQGRLVNLASGDGHPAEIMDTSFAIQALSCEYVAKHRDMPAQAIDVPQELDEMVARMKLESMGFGMDTLTEEQKEYLEGSEAC